MYDMEKFVAKNLLKKIEKYGVTSFCAPPTMYRYIIQEDLTKYNLKKLKYCAIAGEPLNPEVYFQFLKMTGLKVMEGYRTDGMYSGSGYFSVDGTETRFHGKTDSRI